MASKKFAYKSLKAGFEWGVTLKVIATPSLFPLGCQIKAQVRTEEGAPLLATLTTDNGKLVRIDNDTIAITIPGADSKRWAAGSVVLDLARFDVDPDQHLGVKLTVKVETPITSPTA